MEIDPEDPVSRANLADLLMAKKESGAAEEEYATITRKDPKNPMGYGLPLFDFFRDFDPVSGGRAGFDYQGLRYGR